MPTTMHRRHFLELALASLATTAVSPSMALAECAPVQERASWLTTSVRAGGDAYFWLGQPSGLPVPTNLEVTMGAAASRLPITWVVPGVARLRIPGTASGTLQVATPPRGRGEGQTHAITLVSGPPPARIASPPSGVSLVRSSHRIRWGEAQSVEVRFAATPPSIKHVVMRWSRFGSSASLTAGATSATLYAEGGCGSFPVDANAPARGDRVSLAFLDDEGNLSAFTTAVMDT